MNLFRMLGQIPPGALSGNGSAQSRHAHPMSTQSTPSMTSLFGPSALWQEDTRSSQRFTECYDYLLMDIVKKHLTRLAHLGAALPVAVPVAPALAANHRKFRPLIVRINLLVKVLI